MLPVMILLEVPSNAHQRLFRIDMINFLFLFRQPNLQNKPTKATESQQQQQSKKPQVSAQTIVKSQKLIPKKIEKESTQLDFFGRVIKTPVKGEGMCFDF